MNVSYEFGARFMSFVYSRKTLALLTPQGRATVGAQIAELEKKVWVSRKVKFQTDIHSSSVVDHDAHEAVPLPWKFLLLRPIYCCSHSSVLHNCLSFTAFPSDLSEKFLIRLTRATCPQRTYSLVLFGADYRVYILTLK